MKKSVIIIGSIIIVLMIALVGFARINGYATWTNQISKNNLGTCIDTDGGKEYRLSGTVTWTFRGRSYVYKDHCTFGIVPFITEYHCSDRNAPVPTSYNCAKAGGMKGTCNPGNEEQEAYCE